MGCRNSKPAICKGKENGVESDQSSVNTANTDDDTIWSEKSLSTVSNNKMACCFSSISEIIEVAACIYAEAATISNTGNHDVQSARSAGCSIVYRTKSVCTSPWNVWSLGIRVTQVVRRAFVNISRVAEVLTDTGCVQLAIVIKFVVDNLFHQLLSLQEDGSISTDTHIPRNDEEITALCNARLAALQGNQPQIESQRCVCQTIKSFCISTNDALRRLFGNSELLSEEGQPDGTELMFLVPARAALQGSPRAKGPEDHTEDSRPYQGSSFFLSVPPSTLHSEEVEDEGDIVFGLD